jgi:hypothetical protein
MLQQIEERFRQMEADGYIDANEMKELMARLRSQGLDGAALMKLYDELKGADSSVRGTNKDKFADAFGELLEGEIEKTRDNQSELQLEIQLQTADMTNYGYAASQLSKQEHSVYMHIIGNMKA